MALSKAQFVALLLLALVGCGQASAAGLQVQAVPGGRKALSDGDALGRRLLTVDAASLKAKLEACIRVDGTIDVVALAKVFVGLGPLLAADIRIILDVLVGFCYQDEAHGLLCAKALACLLIYIGRDVALLRVCIDIILLLKLEVFLVAKACLSVFADVNICAILLGIDVSLCLNVCARICADVCAYLILKGGVCINIAISIIFCLRHLLSLTAFVDLIAGLGIVVIPGGACSCMCGWDWGYCPRGSLLSLYANVLGLVKVCLRLL